MRPPRHPFDVLTRPGRMVAAGAVAALVAGAAGGMIELSALGAIGLALVAACGGWVILYRPNLSASRRVVPVRVEVGTHAVVELTVTNTGRWVSPVAVVHDPVTSTAGARLWLGSLRAGSHATAAYRIPTARRGRFEIGPLLVTVADPFGLAARARTTGPRTHVTVLPRVERIPARLAGGGRDERPGPPRGDLLGQGDEFAALRPYVRGDDLRRVHWRSSARFTELLVRQDEPPAAGRLTVLADIRAKTAGPAAQEHVVSAAASVLSACSTRGDAVRLVTSSGADSGAASGARHLDRLLDELAVLGPDYSMSLERALAALTLDPAESLVVITAGMSADDLVSLAAVARHAVLVQFAPSSWSQGVGRGLPSSWEDPAERQPDDAVIHAAPRGFAATVMVTASNPFASAWMAAR